jgi:hypothetical protein
MSNLFIKREARFSDDRRYRYWLKIVWQPTDPLLGSVGLNPSRADEFDDDNTIRKEIGFAQRWGFGGLLKANIYGYVSPYPKDLKTVEDPIGGELNSFEALNDLLKDCPMTLAGWGRNAGERGIQAARELAALGVNLYCLGKNSDGSPEHPLYIPYTRVPVPFKCEVANV